MFRKILLFASGLLACMMLSIQADAITSSPLDNELQNTIQIYLNQNQQTMHISAVQLSVLLPGELKPRDYVVGTRYYGNPTIPATNAMLMQWGSITKEYTDTLIFQLINHGILQKNDTLLQLFPEKFAQDNSYAWPSAWSNVTLTQLMNMTSGITDYTSLSKFQKAFPPPQYSFEDLVSLAGQYQNQHGCLSGVGCFVPGTSWFYSNTNYIILGMIVEKYTGAFDDVINQNVLGCFQNKGDSIYYLASTYPDNILAQMIQGYFFMNGTSADFPWINITDWNMSWTSSAGAMLGNMDSLVKITDALYNNKINPDNNVTIDELQQNTVQVSNDQKINGQPVTNPATQCVWPNQLCYAMGVWLGYTPQTGAFWWYEGNTLGYATLYIRFPNTKVIIAVSQNASDNNELQNLALQTIYPVIQRYLLSNSN